MLSLENRVEVDTARSGRGCSRRRGRNRSLGFTLVEMLVVLAIMGISAGAVVLAMGTAGRDASESEARRLAARLSLAADAALVDDAAHGFDWDAHGYRFLRQGARGWQADASEALEPHALPSGIRIEAAGAHPLPIGADAGGAPLDLAVIGPRGRWTVRFDGVAASASAGGGA